MTVYVLLDIGRTLYQTVTTGMAPLRDHITSAKSTENFPEIGHSSLKMDEQDLC